VPPNETSTVTVRAVVFANVSSQRDQLPDVPILIVRLIATPPSTTGAVVLNASVPSNLSPKPRISSPLNRPVGSLAGMPDTRTRIPPKPKNALSVIARMLPVSRIGGAASWICQFAPLAVVTVVTARAGDAATSAAAAAVSNSEDAVRTTQNPPWIDPARDAARARASALSPVGQDRGDCRSTTTVMFQENATPEVYVADAPTDDERY
jgi:hypothetical protein